MRDIIFTLRYDSVFVQEKYYPEPASKNVPSWYKEMETGTENKQTDKQIRENQTIKRCMPVFDSIISGYIIKTFTDLIIEIDENNTPSYYWAYDALDSVQVHPPHQVNNYKNLNLPIGAPKIRNPWGIKTEKGYSCLFISPMHRPSCGIKILEGVVDTDKYTSPVEFPFLMDKGFTGIIPAGTPIAQVIPFKREVFKMKIGGEVERKEQEDKNYLIKSTFINGYRNNFRTKKEYQ